MSDIYDEIKDLIKQVMLTKIPRGNTIEHDQAIEDLAYLELRFSKKPKQWKNELIKILEN